MTDSLFEIVNRTAAHDAACASFGLPQSWWIPQEVDKGPITIANFMRSPVTNISLCKFFLEAFAVCVLITSAGSQAIWGFSITALVTAFPTPGSFYKADLATILLTIIMT